MSELTREELWELVDQDGWTRAEFHSIATALGYVKLDVDPDRLRLALSRWDDVDANYITGVTRQVLAALD